MCKLNVKFVTLNELTAFSYALIKALSSQNASKSMLYERVTHDKSRILRYSKHLL